MDISRLKSKDLKVWLPLFDDVEVLCNHISQSQFEALRRKCATHRFDPKTHQRIEEVDDERFRAELGRAVVVDWQASKRATKTTPARPRISTTSCANAPNSACWS